ncbi:MAG: SH3 domain-containing protein, partial [Bacillota bacterium]|nr:SH3 domain-containing protein [Bacillota bacterium]
MMHLDVSAAQNTEEVEITELNQIMQAVEEVEAKAAPEDTSEIVITYAAGAPVYVTGETTDGWYKVFYQDKEGFVHKSELTETELDVSTLDEELEAAEEESKMVVEEVERYRAEIKRSRIWGTIIVLLVVGIFATGIISTVRAEKEEKKKSAQTEGMEENKEDVIDLDKED